MARARFPPGCLLVTRQNRGPAPWDRRAVFQPVMDDAPAIRGRWHRVPRDGAPREQRRVPDIVPQLGTRKQNPTARTHQAKPAKKWTDGVLRKCQRRGPDAPRIRADKMCRGTRPRPWPAAPAGRENAAKDVATSAARPGARRAAGGTAQLGKGLFAC